MRSLESSVCPCLLFCLPVVPFNTLATRKANKPSFTVFLGVILHMATQWERNYCNQHLFINPPRLNRPR